MRGPVPKDPSARLRRNKATTRATLHMDAPARKRTPKLPPRGQGREWHPLTLKYWRDIWRSPMSAEYLDADVHGLYRMTALVDQFWHSPSIALSDAIARLEAKYGLSPLDRRRLEWIVERAQESKRSLTERRPIAPVPIDDPRRLLQVVV